MDKIKFNFSKKDAKKIFYVLLKYKYLLFLIFFSVSLGFVFIIIHKYAYVDIKFIEYEESYENRVILNIKKSNRALKEILANIKERNKKFEMRKSAKYNNPFEFRELDALKSDEANNQDVDTDKTDENSSVISSPVGTKNYSMPALPVKIENN